MTPASNGTSATTDSSTTPAIDAPAGMPAERIGRRLLAMRRQSGLSARSAAALLGVSRADLRAFELGKSAAPHAVLDRLASIYGCRPSDLVDERNGEAVDVAPSHVQVGSAARRLSPEASDEEVLRQYLSAVYELRSLRPGSDLPLRDADLALLADVLGDTTDEIEARLVELIHCSRDEARAIRRALLRRRLAIPATGLLIGAGAFTPAAAAADENPALLVHRILDRVTAEVSDVADALQSIEPPAEVAEPAAPVEVSPPAPSTPEPAPAPPVVDDGAPEDRGEDWAEIIPPLVIENPDA